jgi:hypothetical protein
MSNILSAAPPPAPPHVSPPTHSALGITPTIRIACFTAPPPPLVASAARHQQIRPPSERSHCGKAER